MTPFERFVLWFLFGVQLTEIVTAIARGIRDAKRIREAERQLLQLVLSMPTEPTSGVHANEGMKQ